MRAVGDLRARPFLQHGNGAGQPFAVVQGSERLLAEALVVGRVEEGERGTAPRCRRGRGAVRRGGRCAVAPLAERLDVVADQPRLGAAVDEQAERGAARDGFEAERAGAGEQIDDARAVEREVPSTPCARMLNSCARGLTSGAGLRAAGRRSRARAAVPATILMPSSVWGAGMSRPLRLSHVVATVVARLSSAAVGAHLVGQHVAPHRLGLAGSSGRAAGTVRTTGRIRRFTSTPRWTGCGAPRAASRRPTFAITRGARHAVDAGLDRTVAHALDPELPSFSLSRAACCTRPCARTR